MSLKSWQDVDASLNPAYFADFLAVCSANEQISAYKMMAMELLEIKPGQSLLNAGCGSGEDTKNLALKVGSDGVVLGIDKSAALIGICQQKNQPSAVNIDYRVDDIHDLQLRDHSFDRIFVDRVFQHLQNPALALSELKRVLKPNGLMVIADPSWSSLKIKSYDNEITKSILQCQGKLIPNYHITDELPDLFQEAGLEIQVCKNGEIGLTSFAEANQVMLLEAACTQALQDGFITDHELSLWFAELQGQDAQKIFKASISGVAFLVKKIPCDKITTLVVEPAKEATLVNDVHCQLNATRVEQVLYISTLKQLQAEIKRCALAKKSVCIVGGRHAMGSQQFATDAVLFDLTKMNRLLDFDYEAGFVTVESGIQWPQLIRELKEKQKNNKHKWTIAQKQTGADRLSLGGAVSANVHGRGLNMAPFVQDIEELTLVSCDGSLLKLNRHENSQLFSLVVGGYGLFGVIYSIKLRLVPQVCLLREVEISSVDMVAEKFEKLRANGCTYADFQFSIDNKSPAFLHKGILSSYKPVEEEISAMPPVVLSAKKWHSLVHLAHKDKNKAFNTFASHYLLTSGQKYLSDDFQLANYLDYYHEEIDALDPHCIKGSEIITELYVPIDKLADFMRQAATLLKDADVIYGTVRLIKKDKETFLPWANKDFACIIFNLHVIHNQEDIVRVAELLRGLIDLAMQREGSYYLTYHKFARKDQVETCYPQFKKFLAMKLKYDPNELFQSNWYRHYKQMFVGEADLKA
ncbi:MAG: methyltransferase domain-containing protein [Candidatus Obscuribacterales bacterium]|nr:methyltransferase domain-containing protein [Candidatus Obscuribacterales bacterium]